MKILVTGATGLVGTRFCQLAVQKGHEIIAVSRDPVKARRERSFPATFVSWGDLSKPLPMSVDVVVNLAGESVADGPWSAASKARLRSSRLDAISAINQSIDGGLMMPRVWINASAIGYYGDRSKEELTESSKRGEGFLADLCHEWESSFFAAPSSGGQRTSEIRKVALRIGLVLSHKGGMLKKVGPLFRQGLGAKLGNGRQFMSWIHLDDLASMIMFAIEQDRVKGIFNAVAPSPVTNAAFTDELVNVCRTNRFIGPPRFLLKALGDFSQILIGSQNVSASKITSEGFKFKYTRLVDAFEELRCDVASYGIHELYQEQWIDRTPEEIFPFFSDETNLERLTPDLLNFKVLRKNTPAIAEGTLIDYRLKIRGVPAKWRTQILKWDPPRGFVDTQLKGPYKIWHHTHSFVPLGGGTLMTDRVFFKLPVWPFGEVALPMVGRDVSQIFGYRLDVVNQLFPDKPQGTS